jgi:hypothetical protein
MSSQFRLFVQIALACTDKKIVDEAYMWLHDMDLFHWNEGDTPTSENLSRRLVLVYRGEANLTYEVIGGIGMRGPFIDESEVVTEWNFNHSTNYLRCRKGILVYTLEDFKDGMNLAQKEIRKKRLDLLK